MKTLLNPSEKQLKLLRAALHVLSLLPLAWLVAGGFAGWFGDSTVRTILWETGDWSLYFLCITLAVTPVRRLTGWDKLVTFRRLPGMYAFLYGALHFGTFLWLRRSADLLEVFARILTRPSLLTGFVAMLIMALLAATSFYAAFKWLGVTGWKWLHRLTYVCAVLAAVHYWQVAARYGSTKPLWFGALVAALLLFRAGWSLLQGSRSAAVPK